MVEASRGQTVQELVEAAGLQSAQGVPKQISNSLQPSIEINPKLLRTVNIGAHATKTGTGGSVLWTTSSVRDTYLTSACLSADCDAASDAIEYEIEVIVGGRTFSIVYITKLAAENAISRGLALNFTPPMKLDRGTTVTVRHTHTLGTSRVGGCFTGYEVDDT